jgi:hypothetical protein
MLTAVPGHRRSVATAEGLSQRDRRFFTGMAVAAAATTFIGFAPTYYLKAAYSTPELPPLVHLHGIMFTSWIALLAIQTSLIALRQTDVHRRLGIGGAVLAGLMTVVAPIVAIAAVRRGRHQCGVSHRADGQRRGVSGISRSRAHHAAQAGGAQATDGTGDRGAAQCRRWPVVRNWGALGDFGVTDMFVVALLIYDVSSRRRVHPATLWGGLFLIASQPVRMAIGGTDTWLAFARWLTG